MLSIQARLVKLFLKANWREWTPELNSIPKYRADFERDLKILFPTLSSRHVKRRQIAGVTVEEVDTGSDARRMILYAHGGAFALGSSRSYRQHLVRIARICRSKVLSVDYSLAPEYPFPAALNEMVNVWREMCLEPGFDPAKIVWMGDSAGANILLAASLKLRDEGLPLPGCLVLLSPGLDATFEGESFQKNKYKDLVLSLSAIDFYMRAYVQGNDKKNPLISPVFADLRGLPPLLIQVGSDELQFSSSQKLYEHAKRDGVEATLFVGERMWHAWHLFAGIVPEGKQAIKEVRAFIGQHVKD